MKESLMVFSARKVHREPRLVRIDSWGRHCLSDVWRRWISQQRSSISTIWYSLGQACLLPVLPFQDPWVFCFVFLESAWLHPCRKPTLPATPSPKNLGSCSKRHFTHTLNSPGRAVWHPAQPFWVQRGKVEPSCIVKFLSVRSFRVTGEIMKEKNSAGLNKFSGF